MTRKQIDNSAAAHASQRKEFYEAMVTMAAYATLFFILGGIYFAYLLLDIIF